MLEVLLAFGLALSVGSQLRNEALGVGPAELCLAVWILLTLYREAIRTGSHWTPALSRLCIFWAFFALAESLGTLTASIIGDVHDSSLFLHDAMAYPLLVAVSCLAVIGADAERRLRRVAWLLVTLGAIGLALQVANGWELFNIANLDPWYWDRFRGWSQNPNQLALYCIVIALLAIHLAESARRLSGRIVAAVCSIVAIYVGRLTKSDTFVLALIAAGPIFVALKLRSWLSARERTLPLRSALAFTLILAAPLTAVSVVPLGYAIAVQAETFAKEVSKDAGEGTDEEVQLRLASWHQAINRGLQSGALGLGPGPHLEIPPSLVAARKTESEPKYIEHPEVNSTPNFEAHNTLLDLFTQGGLIAVLSFIWLTAATLLITYTARLDGLTILVCGLLVFSVFHLIVRQPLFWFATAFCLVSGESCRVSPVRTRS
jgi:O-antigen ligase